MPYIGNPPAERFTSFAYQDLTGGSGTSFTLDNAVGNTQEIEVFVNNVRQEPGVAYTVSGTGLTMTGSVASTDDFYVVFQGKAIQTATHPSDRALTATDGTFTGDLTVDTDTLKVLASSDRVGVNNASPDTTMKVNFSSASTAGFGINDTNSGNLGGMLQFYSGAGNGTLRGNIQNANNAGVHFALGTGSVTFDNTGYVSANALDDYEEGTWTATLEGSTTNPSSTVQTASARYTKVGRQVFVQGQFSNVDTTGASGAPRVTGLPFGASTSFATGNVMFYNRFTIGTTAANVSPYVSGTTMFFYQSTNQTGWAEVAHYAGTGAYLAFTAVYDI